jgi:cytochrome oxidase Cu insertion factor (SCO1/SenC/PrrC family)
MLSRRGLRFSGMLFFSVIALGLAPRAIQAQQAPSTITTTTTSDYDKALLKGVKADRNGDYEESIGYFLQALALKPDDRLSHYYLAMVYWHNDDLTWSKYYWELVAGAQLQDRYYREAKIWLAEHTRVPSRLPKLELFIDKPQNGMAINVQDQPVTFDTEYHTWQTWTEPLQKQLLWKGPKAFKDGLINNAEFIAPRLFRRDRGGNLFFADDHYLRYISVDRKVGTVQIAKNRRLYINQIIDFAIAPNGVIVYLTPTGIESIDPRELKNQTLIKGLVADHHFTKIVMVSDDKGYLSNDQNEIYPFESSTGQADTPKLLTGQLLGADAFGGFYYYLDHHIYHYKKSSNQPERVTVIPLDDSPEYVVQTERYLWLYSKDNVKRLSYFRQ